MVKLECWKQIGEGVELRNRALLITPGTVPSCCYFIEAGTVFAYIENDNGLKDAYCIFHEGDLVLEQDLIRGKENLLYYETIGKVHARRISRFQLEQALRDEPELLRDLLSATMKFGDNLLEQTWNKKNGNAASRLSNLLLNLAKTHGIEEQGTVIINLKLSQEVLAQMAGLHRITVVREMKKMREQSLIMKKIPWYVIPNLVKLKDYRNQQCGMAS